MANELKRVTLDGKQPKFKVGDEVTWTSQANGGVITKKGTVVAILEPGEDATKHVIEASKAAGERYGSGRDRTGGGTIHQRYLVKVPREGVAGALAPYWYSPLVSVADRPTTRVRRGKVVEIPPEWQGQVTGHQTKNKRRQAAIVKRKTAAPGSETRRERREADKRAAKGAV
jgi:hypothetical protein